MANLPIWPINELPDEVIETLDAAPSATLYSLQPWGGPDLPEWDFHGTHVLGHIDLRQQKAREAINEFKDSAARMDSLLFREQLFSNCTYEPRHALRVISGSHTYDLLLCFHCGGLEVYRDGAPIADISPVSGSPQRLNAIITAAHIPLADTPAAQNEGYAEEAKVALRRAEQGEVVAQKVIGMMYLKGNGVRKDEAEGTKWMRKMVEHGNAKDRVYLGRMYQDGWGVKQDYVEAAKWYRLAADQGDADAQLQLSGLYQAGEGVKQDYAEAMKWKRKAADQGNDWAQDELGWMYEQGHGVKQDHEEAYFWAKLGKNGPSSSHLQDEAAAHLTSEQKAALDKRVQEWKPVVAPTTTPAPVVKPQ